MEVGGRPDTVEKLLIQKYVGGSEFGALVYTADREPLLDLPMALFVSGETTRRKNLGHSFGAAAAVEIVYRGAAIYWLDGMPVGYGHGFLKLLGRPARALNELPETFPFQLWAPFGFAPSRIGEFALGMIGAFAMQQNTEKFKRLLLSRWATLVGLVLWLGGSALLIVGRWSWAFADLLIAAGLVLWLINLARLVQDVFPRLFKKMSSLGVWSYYLFLTHLLFGYAHANLYVLWAGSKVMVVLMLLVTLVAMIASSWLLMRLDRSGLPKKFFDWIAGALTRPRTGSKLAPVK